MNEMSLVSTWHSDDIKVQKAFYGVPSTHASISYTIKSQYITGINTITPYLGHIAQICSSVNICIAFFYE